MRSLIDTKDLAQNTTEQNRCGETVTITSDNVVTNCGFLRFYKSIESVESDLLYFTGFDQENDGAQGYYARTDEGLEEDTGVVIKIGNKTFKRKYSGEVMLEWFSKDYATALLRAAKYSYIILKPGKEYPIRRQVYLTLERDLHINLNSADLSGYNQGKSTFIITFKDKHISFTVTKGFISDYANIGDIPPLPKFFFLTNKAPTNKVDLHTLVIYNAPVAIQTNQIISKGFLGDPIASVGSPVCTIKGEKTFTQEFKGAQLSEIDPVRPNDLVTRAYLKKANLGEGLARIDKDQEVQDLEFLGGVYAEPITDVADLGPDVALTEASLPAAVEYILKPELERMTIGIPIPVGGCYIQYSKPITPENGPFDIYGYPLSTHPCFIWPASTWNLANAYISNQGQNIQVGRVPIFLKISNTAPSDRIISTVSNVEVLAKKRLRAMSCRLWLRHPTADYYLRYYDKFNVEYSTTAGASISNNTISFELRPTGSAGRVRFTYNMSSIEDANIEYTLSANVRWLEITTQYKRFIELTITNNPAIGDTVDITLMLNIFANSYTFYKPLGTYTIRVV